MCRLLGYLGPPIQLDSLLLEPPHSLMVQSYAPKELEVAKLNADGFGLGWYRATGTTEPFTYRNILPIWNDPNLEPLCRYVTTGCAVAYVRSATPGQGVDISNCQPFQSNPLLFTHNGYIQRFRKTLYQPMRQMMSDRIYAAINGSTDSEHIWGVLLTALATQPTLSLREALQIAIEKLARLAADYDVSVAANVLVSDGEQLVGSRFASHNRAPSLYWLRDDPHFPDAVLVASEPFFDGNWASFDEFSLFTITSDCDIQFHPLDRFSGLNAH
ncbi:ergothioneine biosynthesis protein EgtC [Oscillatoria sp. CS-180]|uniref:ergothioneine biosynthesis protein EgtC n=1 Tax=Oscillatoria sp. CS-180 TaxID=3021720 RepID=UPI00232B3B35|nr:ergothioneine biosynthesis protein EgtC [Oscillatoria sp. CS-180]MDB9528899.1 ergothioneine biosynthesis protein EgtC [Oscillatoria sp. CS-180]